MNWGKLKSFLIVLFLIINVFLIVSMFISYKVKTTISDETIQNTVSILKRNDIIVDPSIIDNAVKNVHDITLKPITKSDNFSAKFTLKDYNAFEMTFSEKISDTDEMKKILSNASIKDYKIEKEFSNGFGIVSQKAGGYTIFDTTVEVESNAAGTRVMGEWYEIITKPKKNKDFDNIVILPSILINYISNSQRPEGEQKITDIEYGYYVTNKNSDSVIYTAIPCWRIEVDSAMNFYYNARNGEYMTMLSFQ